MVLCRSGLLDETNTQTLMAMDAGCLWLSAMAEYQLRIVCGATIAYGYMI